VTALVLLCNQSPVNATDQSGAAGDKDKKPAGMTPGIVPHPHRRSTDRPAAPGPYSGSLVNRVRRADVGVTVMAL
jgi:hypothetical protein